MTMTQVRQLLLMMPIVMVPLPQMTVTTTMLDSLTTAEDGDCDGVLTADDCDDT